MFNVVLFAAGALVMLAAALHATRARRALMTRGVKVKARVAGTVHTRGGVSLALEFVTPAGPTRRLPYPLPRKAKGFEQGSEVTLYYDPDRPDKLFVEGDRAMLGAELVYYLLAAMLAVLAVVMLAL